MGIHATPTSILCPHLSFNITPRHRPPARRMAHLLRFPRPSAFLHLVSLRTAAEFIAYSLAINKASGLYGVLALFTGYALNPIQLSHYLYSLLVLSLLAYLSPAIRARSESSTPNRGVVLKLLALAWLYVLDTVINAVYTMLFGLSWFIVLAHHLGDEDVVSSGHNPSALGGDTINDTAGFTDPEHSVSHVDVVATPHPHQVMGQEAVAIGSPSSSPTALGSALFHSGSLASLTVLGLLWMIRGYFCLILLSYARSRVRQYVRSSSTSTSAAYTQGNDTTLAENPFHAGREDGAGWTGRLGRVMLRFPTARYWLGLDEDEQWARATSGRFEAGGALRIKVPREYALGERERRARSGTGPPVPIALGDLGKK